MLRSLMTYLIILFSQCPLLTLADSQVSLPCGLTGDINIRIKDCSTHKGTFSLVTRTEDLKEVYIDWKSKLLWGDRLPRPLLFWDAMKACDPTLSEVGGIPGYGWRLPTIQEFQKSDSHHIRSIIPNMNSIFWTSTFVGEGTTHARLFSGIDGQIGVGYTPAPEMLINPDYFYVRCVAGVVIKER